jgi:hypothetical protein
MDGGHISPTTMALNAISSEIFVMKSALDRNPQIDLLRCLDEITSAYHEIIDELLMSHEFVDDVFPLLGF